MCVAPCVCELTPFPHTNPSDAMRAPPSAIQHPRQQFGSRREPLGGAAFGGARRALLTAAAAALAASNHKALAATASLADRLQSRDALQLSKPIFNVVPPEAAYPAWLDGTWSATLAFGGYELPAKDLISREDLFGEPTVPGFQKCSIAFIPDVGKANVTFDMRWARDAAGIVREDREENLRSAIRGGLGYDAIRRED